MSGCAHMNPQDVCASCAPTKYAALREENARLSGERDTWRAGYGRLETMLSAERVTWSNLTRERDEARAKLEEQRARVEELEREKVEAHGAGFADGAQGAFYWQQRAEAAEATLTKLRNEGYRIVELEARLARCVDALEGLLDAWDRAEGGRGCYSCAELHDCRCELARKISTVCTCGRVELDAAAEVARVACAAVKGEEENARLRQRVEELERAGATVAAAAERFRQEGLADRRRAETAKARLAKVVEILNDLDSEEPLPFVWKALAAAKGE